MRRPPWVVPLLLACARLGPPVTPSAPERFVKVEAFDCAKHDVFPGEAPPTGAIPAGTGIRAWHGGGPHGASWNVSQLRCTVRASAACSRGRVALALRVGQQLVGEQERPLAGGTAVFEVLVAETAWEAGLDTPPRGSAGELPFQTASFRALVALDCEAPPVNLREWNYAAVTAEDSFIAGFASGE